MGKRRLNDGLDSLEKKRVNAWFRLEKGNGQTKIGLEKIHKKV